MPNIQTVTCIRCPRGCSVAVHFDDEKIVEVSGNACPRGNSYARAEVTHPVRTVTTTIPVDNGVIDMVSGRRVDQVCRVAEAPAHELRHGTHLGAVVERHHHDA